MTVTIRSNASTTSDVLIPDMGILVPGSGGEEVFDTLNERMLMKQSTDLLELATDDFGNGTPTLVLNDGANDIPPGRVEEFMSKIDQDFPQKAARDSGNSSVVYVGRSEPNALTSDASWQIYRVNISSPSNRVYAGGNANFDKIWDDRETLSYS